MGDLAKTSDNSMTVSQITDDKTNVEIESNTSDEVLVESESIKTNELSKPQPKTHYDKSQGELDEIEQQNICRHDKTNESGHCEIEIDREEGLCESKSYIESNANSENLKNIKEESKEDIGSQVEKEVEKCEKLDTYQQNAIEEKLAEYEKDEWQDKTRRFLENYPLGVSFVEQIGDEIAKDDTLSHNPNCLEIALARVLSKAYMSPKDIINNQDFRQKYVYENKEIKSVIIDKYLQSLDERKPPATMEIGGQILFVPPDKPKSIDEAGEIVRKMLKNRRN